MILVFTALREEGEMLIKEYGMSPAKPVKSAPFPMYEGEGIRLIYTGVGPLNAASAVTWYFTEYDSNEDDILINIGSCCSDIPGGVFIGARITDGASGFEYFPDLFVEDEGLRLSRIVTVYRPVSDYAKELSERGLIHHAGDDMTRDEGIGALPILFEMEASGIFEAARKWLSPHQIQFIKITSDDGTRLITKEELLEYMNDSKKAVLSFVEKAREFSKSLSAGSEVRERQTHIEDVTEKIAEDLICSETMRLLTRQLVTYMFLNGVDVEEELKPMYDDGILPVKTRKEGKDVLNSLLTKYGMSGL